MKRAVALVAVMGLSFFILSASAFAFSQTVFLKDIVNLGADGKCGRSSAAGGSMMDCNTATFTGSGPGGCNAVRDVTGCYFWEPTVNKVTADVKVNVPMGTGTLSVWTGNFGGDTFRNEKVDVFVNGILVGTTNDPFCNFDDDCSFNGPINNEFFNINFQQGQNIIKLTAVTDGGSVTVNKLKLDIAEAECVPGQTQTQPCGNCGSQSRTCQSNGQWGSFGACTGQGVCNPGSSQSQACGNCGTQTRTCQSSCQWGAYGPCTGQGPCSPGTTQSQSCDTGLPGICEDGNQLRTCQSNCQYGLFGNCEQEEQPASEVCNDLDDDCDGAEDEVCSTCIGDTIPTTMNAGQTQAVSVTVRNDGSVPWTAATNYKLGSQNPQDNVIWGLGRVLIAPAVTVSENQQYTFNFNIVAPSLPGTYPNFWRMLKEGEFWFLPPDCGNDVTVSTAPVCTPGQTQTQACGNCGTQTRTCQSNGQWGSFGACTGQGICSPGQQESRGCGTDVGECVAGTETRTCQGNCQWNSFQNCNATGPAPEECDGLDNDCDNQIDDGFDPEDCEGSCEDSGFVWTGNGGLLDCCGNNPYEDDPYEQYETLCDGNDNDCDGQIDEGLTHPCTNYNDCSTFQTCDTCQSAPPELCNGDDDDCDGQIDEGGVCDVDCELEKMSLRGTGGIIDFIDGYDNFASSKIKFSGWLSQNSDGSYYGISSLEVKAKLSDGSPLNLRVKAKVREVNANNCGVLDVDNNWWSLATFQVGDNPPVSIGFDNIHYQWDRNTNLLDISGEGPDLDFSIHDIHVTCINC